MNKIKYSCCRKYNPSYVYTEGETTSLAYTYVDEKYFRCTRVTFFLFAGVFYSPSLLLCIPWCGYVTENQAFTSDDLRRRDYKPGDLTLKLICDDYFECCCLVLIQFVPCNGEFEQSLHYNPCKTSLLSEYVCFSIPISKKVTSFVGSIM